MAIMHECVCVRVNVCETMCVCELSLITETRMSDHKSDIKYFVNETFYAADRMPVVMEI